MWVHGLIGIKGDWPSLGCKWRGFAGRTPAKSFVAKVCLIVCGSRQPKSVITWVTNSLWKKLITRVSRIVDSKMVCLPTHPRRQGQVTVLQGRGVPWCLDGVFFRPCSSALLAIAATSTGPQKNSSSITSVANCNLVRLRARPACIPRPSPTKTPDAVSPPPSSTWRSDERRTAAGFGVLLQPPLFLPGDPGARRSPRGRPVRRPPHSLDQLLPESVWCGSVFSLGLGLPYLAAATGRSRCPLFVETGAWPAKNIRLGYACLFPSLSIPLSEIKHPKP
jgi:hypothetical protein